MHRLQNMSKSMKLANKNAMQGRWRRMRSLRYLDLQPFSNAHGRTALRFAPRCAVLEPNQSQPYDSYSDFSTVAADVTSH